MNIHPVWETLLRVDHPNEELKRSSDKVKSLVKTVYRVIINAKGFDDFCIDIHEIDEDTIKKALSILSTTQLNFNFEVKDDRRYLYCKRHEVIWFDDESSFEDELDELDLQPSHTEERKNI